MKNNIELQNVSKKYEDFNILREKICLVIRHL